MEELTCQTCIFSKIKPALTEDNRRLDLIYCHRHSPGPSLYTFDGVSNNVYNKTVWPIVQADDFCGDGKVPSPEEEGTEK